MKTHACFASLFTLSRAAASVFSLVCVLSLALVGSSAHAQVTAQTLIGKAVSDDSQTQEVTGADGGPITLAAVDLKGLSDAELEQTKTLLAKAARPALSK